MFRYNIRGENIEVTDSIRDYVEKKVGKLERCEIIRIRTGKKDERIKEEENGNVVFEEGPCSYHEHPVSIPSFES